MITGGAMDKAYISIISILIFIIVSLFVYIFVKSSFYNDRIKYLEQENKSLIVQISSAESFIDMQNLKIEEYALNKEKVEEEYKNEIIKINKNYNNLEEKYKNMEQLECNEILKIIDDNQWRFLYEK